MKKKYTSPVVEILETQAPKLLDLSLQENGNSVVIDFNGTPDEGDADEAASRGCRNAWMLLLMLMMTLTAGAQTITTVEPAAPPADGKTHAMKLYLKNNTEVTYTLEELDHVTYLPGIGMKVYLKTVLGDLQSPHLSPLTVLGDLQSPHPSIDYLFSQLTKIDYTFQANLNNNATSFSMTDFPEAWRLEYPHLSSNVSATGAEDNCQVIVKSTPDYGITYSLEWDNAKIANRWTCYQMHEGNSQANVGRKDDFKPDDEVYKSSSLEDYKNSGFSRGHLCPSADRLCSEQQNKQTFFLTNMQPQYQSHNGGLWSNLESLVRNYATDDNYSLAHCDTLYIVKAATISDKVTIGEEQVDGVYTDIKCGNVNQLLVPKYFYIALLHYNKGTDTYHAIAFWTAHENISDRNKNYGDYAITIDELQQRTGIDFFCNLPDNIENDVETQIDLDFWKLTTTE